MLFQFKGFVNEFKSVGRFKMIQSHQSRPMMLKSFKLITETRLSDHILIYEFHELL